MTFLGVQTELHGSLGLGGVVNDQELIGAVLSGEVHAVGRERVLDPQLRGVGVAAPLKMAVAPISQEVPEDGMISSMLS